MGATADASPCSAATMRLASSGMSAAVIPQRTISGVPSRSPDHSLPPGRPMAQAKMLASRSVSAAW